MGWKLEGLGWTEAKDLVLCQVGGCWMRTRGLEAARARGLGRLMGCGVCWRLGLEFEDLIQPDLQLLPYPSICRYDVLFVDDLPQTKTCFHITYMPEFSFIEIKLEKYRLNKQREDNKPNSKP